MAKANTFALVGTGGRVYEDGNIVGYVESIEVKVTGDFEDIECCGAYEKDYAYTGYSCEGTMTYTKCTTTRADQMLDDFENGIMREHTIVTDLTNKNTGKKASYSISNVVYTEVAAVSLSTGVIKETVPFKCSRPRPLSSIGEY